MNPSEFGRLLASLKKGPSGVKPVVLNPCKHCGELMGTRARRQHEPVCRRSKKSTAQPIDKKVGE